MSAAIRITPEMINFLKRKLTGTSPIGVHPLDDPPYQPTAPTIRTSDIAVTDSLPPAYNSQTGDLPNTDLRDVPPNVSLNSIRPRFANSATPPNITATSAQMPPASQIRTAPIINKSLFDAANVPNEETRPRFATNTIRPYNAPVDAPDLTATRARTTQPVDPMIRASENYNAAMGSQPFFGTDKEGNIKPHADKGFGGRAKAALKRFGYGMLRGEGILGAGADAVEGAINPDINAQERLQRTRAGNAREYGGQVQLAGEQARIGQIRANTDWINQRPDLEQQRIAQGGQRIEQGNQRLSSSQVSAERQAVLASLKTRPTLDATRDAELIARARKAGIDVDPANYKGGRPMFIEGVLSDPYTGSPILRDGKQVVDRTKIPVEYDGYTVTPGQAVSARATAAGQAATESRFERGQDRQDVREATNDEKAAQRQEDSDRKSATMQLNLARNKRAQAAKLRVNAQSANDTDKEYYESQASVLDDEADQVEQDAATNYGNVIEQTQPNVFDAAKNPAGAKARYRIKARADAPQGTPQPTQTRGKTLQRMDSSSMDNQVKSHFDKGGKAIKVRDVKTGKETLVDNYNDYLVAIGRK